MKFFAHPDLDAFKRDELDGWFGKVVIDKPKESRSGESFAMLHAACMQSRVSAYRLASCRSPSAPSFPSPSLMRRIERGVFRLPRLQRTPFVRYRRTEAPRCVESVTCHGRHAACGVRMVR